MKKFKHLSVTASVGTDLFQPQGRSRMSCYRSITRFLISLTIMVLTLGALVPVRESAAQNMDLMAKWTSATVVNYKVVADFSGEAVLFTADGLPGRGMVTDRFEVEFDWNQSEFAMIGKPIIKNFPSKLVSVLKNGTCTTTVSGAFEHATTLARGLPSHD